MAIKYVALSDSEQEQILTDSLRSLERQHFQESLAGEARPELEEQITSLQDRLKKVTK